MSTLENLNYEMFEMGWRATVQAAEEGTWPVNYAARLLMHMSDQYPEYHSAIADAPAILDSASRRLVIGLWAGPLETTRHMLDFDDEAFTQRVFSRLGLSQNDI